MLIAFRASAGSRLRGRDDDGDLPFRRGRSVACCELGSRAAHELLVELGELARDDDARRRRDGREILEQIGDAVPALVQDDRAAFAEQLLEHATARPALLLDEADE